MKKLLFTLLLAVGNLTAWAADYPDVLYPVGDATSVGWKDGTGNPTKLYKTPSSSPGYHYEGFVKLTETANGELKFLCQSSWGAMWGAVSNGTDISTENTPYTLVYYAKREDNENPVSDNKFKPSLDAGLYFVEIVLAEDENELDKGTVTFKKWTLATDVYEISTPQQLLAFANCVNKNAQDVNAKFTEDIDFNGVSITYEPIGDDSHRYQGTFDGQGHKISNLHISLNQSNVGVFGAIAEGATIKNFTLDNTCSIYGDSSIGIIGKSQLVGESGSITLSGLGNEADVSGYGKNIAGILGVNVWTDGKGYTTLTMTNCYNTGSISGTGANENGQLTGWGGDGARLTNCYAIGTVNNCHPFGRFGDNPNASNFINCYCGHDGVTIAPRIYDSDLTTGRLCYLLNNPASGEPQTVWHQTLSGTTDAHPVLLDSHETVKRFNAGTNEDPEYWYTNLEVSGSPLSTTISSINNLAEFSRIVNAGQTALNATLEDDITQGTAVYTPIGTTTNQYVGQFNGQGHSVTLSLDNGSYNYQGLFGVVTDGVFIENVIVKGFVTGNQYVGGIVGGTYGSNDGYQTNIWNCGNEADITGTVVGGIIGDNGGTEASIILLNCYNTGDITGTNDNTTAALCGSIGGGNSSVRNCYNIGSVKNGGVTSNNFCVNAGCYFINCYYSESSGTSSYGSGNVDETYGFYSVTDDEVTSGELCYRLGSAFTQDFSTASHPTFGSKEVHIANWFDSGSWDIYYNEEGSIRTAYILNLDDTKPIFSLDSNYTLKAKNVKMKTTLHQLTSGTLQSRWNTFCSPVALPKSNFSEVKELTDVSVTGDHYTMEFSDIVGDNLEAGKPYMVQVASSSPEFTATNAVVANAASSSETYNGLTFNGTFTSRTAPVSDASNSYFIISNNAFYEVDSEVSLKAFRGYITVASGSSVKALSFVFDDDPTAIEMVNGQSSMVNGQPIFNLAGQRINKMQKGINIVNGKKILK